MKGVKGWILLLLLMPLAAGVQVGSLTFTISGPDFIRNGIMIDTVSQNYPRLADIKFNLTGGQFTSIRVDSSELYANNPFKTLVPGASQDGSCVGDAANGYECTVKDILLKPGSGSGNVYLDITAGGNTSQATLQFQFSIDNTQPTLQSINVKGCDASECFIGPDGTLVFELQDSQGTFDNGFIFYYVNSRGPFLVNNCTGMTCEGMSSATCQNGQPVTVRVGAYNGVPSQDDAGNPVYLSEYSSETFTCDVARPVITSYNVTVDSGLPFIAEGDQVTIKFEVQDAAPLTITAPMGKFTGDSNATAEPCNNGVCTLSFTATERGYKKFAIPFTIRDSAGNFVKVDKDFELLSAATELGEDVFRIRKVDYEPKELDRNTLKWYDKIVYAFPELESRGGAWPVRVRMSSCVGESDSLAETDFYSEEPDSPYFRFTLSRAVADTEATEFSINCSMEITYRTQRAAFSEPEIENFSIGFQISEEPAVSTLIAMEINDTQNRLAGVKKVLGYLRAFTQLATTFCNIGNIISTANAAVSTAEAAVCAIPVVGEGLAKPLQAISNFMGNSFNLIGGVGGITESEPYIQYCNLFTCEQAMWGGDFQNKIMQSTGLGALNEGSGTWNYFFGGMTKEDLFRPETSLVWSAATGCVSGVVYNLNQLQEIDCEYERCLQEGLTSGGLSIKACAEAKDFNECKYVRGQVFNIIPPLNVMNNMANIMGSVLSDPLSLGVSAVNMFWKCDLMPACSAHAACAIPLAATSAAQVKTVLNGIQQFQQGIGSAITLGEGEVSACQYLEDLDAPLFYDPFLPYAGDTVCNSYGCENSNGVLVRGTGTTTSGEGEGIRYNGVMLHSWSINPKEGTDADPAEADQMRVARYGGDYMMVSDPDSREVNLEHLPDEFLNQYDLGEHSYLGVSSITIDGGDNVLPDNVQEIQRDIESGEITGLEPDEAQEFLFHMDEAANLEAEINALDEVGQKIDEYRRMYTEYQLRYEQDAGTRSGTAALRQNIGSMENIVRDINRLIEENNLELEQLPMPAESLNIPKYFLPTLPPPDIPIDTSEPGTRTTQYDTVALDAFREEVNKRIEDDLTLANNMPGLCPDGQLCQARGYRLGDNIRINRMIEAELGKPPGEIDYETIAELNFLSHAQSGFSDLEVAMKNNPPSSINQDSWNDMVAENLIPQYRHIIAGGGPAQAAQTLKDAFEALPPEVRNSEEVSQLVNGFQSEIPQAEIVIPPAPDPIAPPDDPTVGDASGIQTQPRGGPCGESDPDCDSAEQQIDDARTSAESRKTQAEQDKETAEEAARTATSGFSPGDLADFIKLAYLTHGILRGDLGYDGLYIQGVEDFFDDIFSVEGVIGESIRACEPFDKDTSTGGILRAAPFGMAPAASIQGRIDSTKLPDGSYNRTYFVTGSVLPPFTDQNISFRLVLVNDTSYVNITNYIKLNNNSQPAVWGVDAPLMHSDTIVYGATCIEFQLIPSGAYPVIELDNNNRMCNIIK